MTRSTIDRTTTFVIIEALGLGPYITSALQGAVLAPRGFSAGCIGRRNSCGLETLTTTVLAFFKAGLGIELSCLCLGLRL